MNVMSIFGDTRRPPILYPHTAHAGPIRTRPGLTARLPATCLIATVQEVQNR